MGKRKKSSRGPVKRVVQRLDTKFNCLFCNHEQSVSCTLDKKNSIGTLSCKICGQSFQTRINTLSQPVDVYSDWFDAVEEVNQGRASESEGDGSEGSSSDYESDSDGGHGAGTLVGSEGGAAAVAARVQRRVLDSDEDEEEVEADDDTHGDSPKRTGRALIDSDDDDDDDE
ncbi:Elf1p KNAG_0B04940 [Huiozyma naganishii CBS 8797]|uniref:Transcription elongation factor 1 homolog n=1 Tax=Huiozyma naganishii (strain ATCC MYA-139 / BCRC 22969 / CBS 8797 / KCTC 17520 / NBRC 10181 / NCYC 3082 / Yp74L-3) TaxID=1071383 RepID=J7RHB3_HUIN7|nr:hypothetical protein KNAG_0B04940 [Kazachstania naganishii CBS 8797]CCK68928.1 hypothetical protein KNAG_0B04940 [Kazachstania naganishii CBS 8797]